jgi:hypothetical protein
MRFYTLSCITGIYVFHLHQRLKYVITHVALPNNRVVQKPQPRMMDETALSGDVAGLRRRGQKQLLLSWGAVKT